MKIYFYARALTQKKPLSLPWRLEQCPYVMSRETETWDSGKETSVGEIIGKSLSGSTKSQTAASFSRLIHREGLTPLGFLLPPVSYGSWSL